MSLKLDTVINNRMADKRINCTLISDFWQNWKNKITLQWYDKYRYDIWLK